MSDDFDPGEPHDLIAALVDAADACDLERVDEILDRLRLGADYELMVEDLIASAGQGDRTRMDQARDRLRSLPALDVFAALRAITN